MEQKVEQTQQQKGEKAANGQEKSYEPHRVQSSALQQMLTDDPGQFQEALLRSGLMLGQIVSLLMEGDKKRNFRGKLAGIDEEGIILEATNGKQYHNKLSDVKEIETLDEGLKFASHELYFPLLGKSIDQLKPMLADLLQGKEIYASDWLIKKKGSKEAQRLDGKIRLVRDPQTYKARLDTTEKHKVVQRPERIQNILITDDKWEQIQSKKGLEAKFEFVNKDNEFIQQAARIYIDPQLNRVRYKFTARPVVQAATPAQSEAWATIQAQSPIGRLIDAVRQLRGQGYSSAWTDPQDINREIFLQKNEQGKVFIGFKNPAKLEGPHLKASSGQDADYVKKTFSAALDIVRGYLNANGLTMAAEPEQAYQKQKAETDAQKGEKPTEELKQNQKHKNRRQKVG
jgi:hypothetical protein